MSQTASTPIVQLHFKVHPETMDTHEVEKRDNQRDAVSQATLDGLCFGLLGVALICALLILLVKGALEGLTEKFTAPPPGAAK